mgnify:CR=1 FL=1
MADATMDALEQAPLGALVEKLGLAIANAQAALDRSAIALAVQLADPEQGIDLGGQRRSLLSLGFAPTFYQFTEATLDIKIEMKVEVEDKSSTQVSANASAAKGPVAMAGTVSSDSSRKYGAESSAMTAVHLQLVSVPPPAPFLEYIRQVNGVQTSKALPSSDLTDTTQVTG